MVWEEMSFEKFQVGRHLGYRKGTILAILNLYNQVLAQSDLWFFEEMLFEEFQDGPRGGHLGYFERNDFSNSESLCHSDASHQVLLNPTYSLV